VSRIIGQQHMLAFLETITPELNEDNLRVARQYIRDRKQYIVDEFLEHLATDGSDDELIESLGPIERKEPPPPEKPSLADRIRRRLKGTLSPKP